MKALGFKSCLIIGLCLAGASIGTVALAGEAAFYITNNYTGFPPGEDLVYLNDFIETTGNYTVPENAINDNVHTFSDHWDWHANDNHHAAIYSQTPEQVAMDNDTCTIARFTIVKNNPSSSIYAAVNSSGNLTVTGNVTDISVVTISGSGICPSDHVR